jgi:hypothetical protein
LNNVVVLPRTAVTPSGNINVIEAGLLKRVPVSALWKDNENIVITNDFNSLQQISISPLGDVVSGTRVEIFDKNNKRIGTRKKGKSDRKGKGSS